MNFLREAKYNHFWENELVQYSSSEGEESPSMLRSPELKKHSNRYFMGCIFFFCMVFLRLPVFFYFKIN